MIYAIVTMKISNPTPLGKYREVAGEALARHSGKLEAAATETTVLDGTPERPDMLGILSFPNREAALAWANDPDLAEVHELRRAGGTSDIMLVG